MVPVNEFNMHMYKHGPVCIARCSGIKFDLSANETDVESKLVSPYDKLSCQNRVMCMSCDLFDTNQIVLMNFLRVLKVSERDPLPRLRLLRPSNSCPSCY